MILVNDEVVKVGLQAVRGPVLRDGPSALTMWDPDSAYAALTVVCDEDVAICGYGRLHDREATPPVLPNLLAIGRRDSGYAGCAKQHDLGNSVHRQQLWRAVAGTAG